MKVLGRLLKFVVIFWKWVVLSVVLGWATTVSWFALIASSAYLISYAALQPSIAELQVAIVGVRFFGITRGVFRYLERLVSHTTTFKILTEMRVKFFTDLEIIVPAGSKEYHSGDLLARIVDDIETLQEFYVRVIYPPLVAALSSVGVLWFLGRWSIKFSLVILCFHLVVGIILPLLTLILARKPGNDLVQNGAGLRSVVVDGIRGIDEVVAFGIAAKFRERIKVLGKQRISLQRKMHLITGAQNSLMVLAINLCVVILFVLAIPMVNSGQLDGKLFAVVILGSLASFEAVMLMPAAMQNIGASYRAGERLSIIFEEEGEISEQGGRHKLDGKFSLEVRDLTFSYPDSDAIILDRINFDLPQGKKLGIVGVSGVGKTTILNILLRHWNWSHGEVLLDGDDLRLYSPDTVRDQISIVDQQVYLFNTTIMENLRLGNPAANQQSVMKASMAAATHDYVSKLPEGYNTIVGEQGTFLSGGEIQRLGIARALLKNASLYLFDEPLAHLDPILQRNTMNSILEYLAGKSVILVTHQILGLPAMDEIIVLQRGRVAERGNHRELLQLGGMYSKMWFEDQETLVET